MPVSFAPNEPLNNMINSLTNITSKGQFNERMQLPKPKPPTPLGGFEGLPGGGGSTGGSGGSGGLPGGDLGKLMRAIRNSESSGRYWVTNPSGALGAYQILWSNMAGNRTGWDYTALGRDVTRDEFLNTPALQDQIAAYWLGKYMRERGMAGAAATWYGGDWGYNHMYDRKPQAGYPSMYDYVMAILNQV